MCTLEKRGSLFILTLIGNDEHRLNPTLIDSIRDALARVRSQSSSSSSALITTAVGKFFSNGYDLNWATNHSGSIDTTVDRLNLMSFNLRSLFRDLISLPMPTIAAVNGHASAGGFILALSHDYILMRKDRGYLYMSELDISLKIPAWFVKLLKNRIASPAVHREIVLKAAKFTATAALEKGIIESSHDGVEETVAAAVKLGDSLVKRGWDGNVYCEIRKVMMSDVLAASEYDETLEDAVKIASKI
ncbi:enoyl-CoA delta isomerase 1, peroxisomal [Impatiens glandulifera]|uniref:enoyl-CoA delta isomerase 1, peroxisomal n=1 Tax=Impatiens glandulifera TaxID=253017 RepID=UPI001FB0C362|nr:enoyl-CoA delta isomerase 1, peroxisomal [Impatiens glandulifera]